MDYSKKHYAEFNETPQYTARIPGVLSFFGFYARKYKGISITASGGRDVYVCASRSERSQVIAYNTASGDRKKLALTSFKYRREDRWANFIKGAYYVAQQIKKEPVPLNITICGENLDADEKICGPMIALGVMLILQEICSLKLSDEAMVKAVCSACAFCNCECDPVRVMTAVTAREGYFSSYDFNTGKTTFIESPFNNSQYRLLCIDSHIPASTMREEISRLHHDTDEVVESYGQAYRHRNITSLSDSEINDRSLCMDEDLRKVALFLKEDGYLATSSEKALKSSDNLLFGKNLSRLGRILRDEIYLTCPELDWIAKRAVEQSGQSSASNVYAGSGSMLCVFTEVDRIDCVQQRLEDYNHIFGFDLSIREFNPLGRACLV